MRFRDLLLIVGLFFCCTLFAQDLQVDSRLRPYLQDFIKSCKDYDIPYRDKLLRLERIAIVSSLPVSEQDATLGMLRRDENGVVQAIEINWMAQIDPEILKIVAFHEFGHYFLEYESHVCDDCDHIMAVINTSYFEIAQNWEHHLKILFEESPAYQRQLNVMNTVASNKKP